MRVLDLSKSELDIRVFQKELARKTNSRFGKYKFYVDKYFARSVNEIDIFNIKPELDLVDNPQKRKIFNYAETFWSVPVSLGFGRRLDFILWDKSNHKVIGVFGLCDPVIGLGVRDDYIGWSKKQREERLYNMLTAYILGAVPPYNHILGGKLVALSAISKEVVDIFYGKYKGRKTIISKKEKPPYLVAIDTMGAFGKSAIYTRLKGWKFIGYTKGKSHLHISHSELYGEIKQKLIVSGKSDLLKSYKFGEGSNYKFRVITAGLKE